MGFLNGMIRLSFSSFWFVENIHRKYSCDPCSRKLCQEKNVKFVVEHDSRKHSVNKKRPQAETFYTFCLLVLLLPYQEI